MGRLVLGLAVCLVAIWVCCHGQSFSSRDPCIDQVYQRFNMPMLQRYPQYANMTISLPTARNVFQALFVQGFTTTTFFDYCATYRRARSEYDRCSRTQYKETVLNGYGVADFVCIHRVNEFARNLPCLQNAHFFTLQSCAPRCYQMSNSIGQSPYNPRGMIAFFDPNQQMAADCQIQRCMAECRRPYFEQQCGREASRLELDALYTTYASIRNIHEPPELRRQYERGRNSYDRAFSTAFPSECYALALNTAVPTAITRKLIILLLYYIWLVA